MNKEEIIQNMEENPVILGMKSWEDLPLVRENDSKVVFTLFGTISDICSLIAQLKEMGKLKDAISRMEAALQRDNREPWDKHDCA